ncbi:tumor necrosis factor receptor superfamily member 1B-like isoform X2 [Ostrea edulis]|uniref:tumor necrosis factor receptor superfamily member 1B-like isoform X2 n=1 Tax=Ostrea edulis TaxID=37623 RepID=UPI0024AF12D7|nr:tumor necrosis factor receptor superfamily member 1B-like isoform X2 [Ostrea edulis]
MGREVIDTGQSPEMNLYLHVVAVAAAIWTGIQTVEDTCSTDFKYHVNSTIECGCCLPGFYKETDCTQSGNSAKCMACPLGYFSLYHNQATRCQPCSLSCTLKNSEIVDNCTSLSDIKCKCRVGFYMSYRTPSEAICEPHSKCQPGFHVQKLGTSTEDTTCKACLKGTFQNRENLESTCKNCSTCSDPSGERMACSSLSDTQCNDEPTSLDKQNEVTTPPAVIAGAVVGVIAVAAVVMVVTVLCHRRGHHIPCLKVTQEERSPNGHTHVEQGQHQEGVRSSENGHHDYALIVPNTEDSPKRDKPVSRRALIEKSWADLSLLLQKDLPISDWKFVIRELYGTVDKSADRVLEEHEANHPRNVKEQIYCCLQSFSQQTDICSYDFQKLRAILCDHDHNELAEKIQKDDRFSPLFPGNS